MVSLGSSLELNKSKFTHTIKSSMEQLFEPRLKTIPQHLNITLIAMAAMHIDKYTK